MSARHDLHRAGVATVARALRARGCAVTVRDHGAVSLEVNGLAVAVRVARRRMAHHPVTVGGRRYDYRYPILHFNLHAHNRKIHAPDVWVLVAVDSPRRVWIVPAAVVARTKTVQILDTASARQSTRGRVREYEGRWEVITDRRARRRAA